MAKKNIGNILLTNGQSSNYNYKNSTLAKRTAKKVAKKAASGVVDVVGAVGSVIPTLVSGKNYKGGNIFTKKQIDGVFGLFSKKRKK